MDFEALVAEFRGRFGQDPELISIAPGRINLIGEHTDYNEGFVFPVAIDRGLRVAARRVSGPSELYSMQMGRAMPFDSSSVAPGDSSDWGRYAAGMAWVMRRFGAVSNVQAVVNSEVPIGSGVSSSAAMELAFGVVYNDFGGFTIENKELALLGQEDENEFVGVKCGIMDQMASAMGREGQAMFLDTRTLEILYAEIPSDLAIVLCDTKTPRALTDSAYNERRSQCEEAARILGVKALRDADTQSLELKKNLMSDVVYRRAKHVITENARCQLFIEALNTSRRERIGELMQASHESLRDDYEVSSKELDFMAEAAWNAPGCVGARMTGAGFGGACVALVERNRIKEFTDMVNFHYRRSSGLTGEILACEAVQGARVLWRSGTPAGSSSNRMA